MDQLTHMLDEANARERKIKSSGFDARTTIDLELRNADSQLRIINQAVTIFAIDSKSKRRECYQHMKRLNILDCSSAVGLFINSAELDKIKCPLKDGAIITRSECMDLNGEKDNYTYCRTCEQKGETARALSPAA